MLAIIATDQRYLGENLARIARDAGQRVIRTSQVERVMKELKARGRVIVIDMRWEEVQKPGILSQMVNIGRISRNQVVCICPDREEDLKDLAKKARPAAVFIRYELETAFKDYMVKAEIKSK